MSTTGVVSGKHGGHYDAAEGDYNYCESLGSDGSRFRNYGTAVRLVENFVRGIFNILGQKLAVVLVDHTR